MKKLISVLLVLSFSTQSFADTCPKSVQLLNKGDQAPCKGFLFSEQEEQKMYLLDENSKLMQQELDIKTKYITTVNKELTDYQVVVDKEKQESELWRKAAEDSTQKLIETQSHTWQRDVLMFALGILTTVGAGYAVGAAARH